MLVRWYYASRPCKILKMWLCLAIIVAVNTALTGATPASGDVMIHCLSRGAQRNIAIDLLMGPWHIVEVIHHLSRDRINGVRYMKLPSCPLVQLTKMDKGHYRVNWIEDSVTLYYDAKRSDSEVDGYWIASGPHNHTGPMMDTEQHHPFTGIIEVMKAVSNHAVLTFCKSDHANSHLFSIILARDFSLSNNEVRGVNNMLLDRNLPHVLIKKTCNNGKTFIVSTFTVLLLSVIGRLFA